MSTNPPGAGAPTGANLWTTTTQTPGSIGGSIAPGSGTAGMSPGLYTAVSGYVRGSEFGGVLTSQWGLYTPLYLGVGQHLPAQASPGQVAYYLADAANSIVWQFVYFGALQQGQFQGQGFVGFPWIFVGGSSALIQVSTNENTASVTYADLATVGPQYTAPFAGDYDVWYGADINGISAAGNYAISGIVNFTKAPTTSYTYEAFHKAENASNETTYNNTVRVTGANAGDNLRMRYRVTAGNANFSSRWMRVTPVRVAGV